MMIKKRSKLTLVVAAAVGLIIPIAASATDGYFDYGYGTKDKGMGGAGVALGQDAMAAATNPAGMVFAGDRYDLGYAMFAPNRGYDISGNAFAAMNQSQTSDIDFFVVPHMAVNWMLAPDKSFGVTVYGNGGMNTEYSNAVFKAFGGTAPTGVDLIQLFVSMSYAQKITSNSALGISVIPVLQNFKAYGLEPFKAVSSDPTHVTNNGTSTSTGVGFKIGGQTNVGGGVTLGASYQPKISMSKFDKYAGLFAEQGGFDIPSTYTLGAAWKVTSNWDLLFDYQRINYEDVKSVSNPSFAPPPFGPSGSLLGAADGPGFGWSNVNVYKLGTQYTAGSWTWRAGWNHCNNPISNNNVELMFNILAPGVITDHITLGLTKTMSPTSEINFAYAYARSHTITGFIPTDAAHFGGGTVSLHMYQNVAELSLDTKF